MTRFKKFAALVLAMMMALTTLVVPAMAAGNDHEGIVPLYLEGICPRHGVYERVTTSYAEGEMRLVAKCSEYPARHTHTFWGTEYTYACGYFQEAWSVCDAI